MEYKVLTLWQPWASLLVHGAKKIETRPKPTTRTAEKGTYLIHAASKWTKEQERICFQKPFYKELLNIADEIGFDMDPFTFKTKYHCKLPLGQIIGAIEVTQCQLIIIDNAISSKATVKVKNKNEHVIISSPEYHFGDYTPGRYAWLTQNPRVLKTPIPYKGGQGYYVPFKGDVNDLQFL